MFKKTSTTLLVSSFILTGVLVGFSFIKIQSAYAASLSTLSDVQSSLRVSTSSNHTIQFVTPLGIAAGESISITFPTGYATGTFAIANFDLATSTSASCSGFGNAPLTAGAASGITWGVVQATSTIYITSGTAVVPAGRCVQIRIGSNAVFQASGTEQIVNPSTPGQYGISIVSGSGDTGLISEDIITDDAVFMTGTINQSLTFTISTTTIYFGTLGAGSAKYASSSNISGDTQETIAHTLAVGTNAPSGFTLSVRGQTLTSQQNSSNTITPVGAIAASSTPGTEQFGVRVTESGGVGTAVSSPFDLATSYGYNATATTSATLATGSGSTPTSTFSLRYVVNIAAVTEAGTYAANLVYVATANF
jgi:hypothetical protein